MKSYPLHLFLLGLLFTFSTSVSAADDKVKVAIDLVKVKKDKVKVTVTPAAITTSTVTFQLPKIIPGTYAIADYGQYVENFSAKDRSGKALVVTKADVNTWQISGATALESVTYYVNDTYDSEKGSAFGDESNTIFSPAGTNILKGKQFMLNLAGFVGYFENQKNNPYEISIKHPAHLTGTSSMDDADNSATTDVFRAARYAEVVDSPIMYATPDIASFSVDSLNVVLHVYSPVNKDITAKALLPDLQRMVVAQKKFLGNINHTKKYVVLLYITNNGKEDARGIGALEHNRSTTAVFMQTMTSSDLIHVISHEFFHTLTPLNVHSKEIQDFDFNKPKMSAHLWMYEGITEYFAHLFQVKEGLIAEDKFLYEMADKEFLAKRLYPKDVSFTDMSKNILDPEMKKVYPNVYQKGALMAMCIDLILRDKSNGEKGIKDMMAQLQSLYGPEKPFDDDEIIAVITSITYPEVGDFIQRYIVKGEALDYENFLRLAGVSRGTIKAPVQIAFIVDGKPYISIDKPNKQVLALVPDNKNEFVNAMGLQDGDVILEINTQKLDVDDMVSILGGVYKLEEGKAMVIKVKRKGQILELKANAKLNYVDTPGFVFTNPEKLALKNSWIGAGQ